MLKTREIGWSSRSWIELLCLTSISSTHRRPAGGSGNEAHRRGFDRRRRSVQPAQRRAPPEAPHVVVAMASYQQRKVPDFASELSPEIVQLHSSEYKGLSQLEPGGVLVVGAANSGAEIAAETVTKHPTWLSGRDPGQVPFP